MTKGLVRALLRARHAPQPGYEALERVMRFAGYLRGELVFANAEPNRFQAQTQLAKLLGPEQHLVVFPDSGLLFDSARQSLQELSASETLVLLKLAETSDQEEALASAIAEGLEPERARKGLADVVGALRGAEASALRAL